MLNNQAGHAIEIMFLQGVHFNQIQEYFLTLVGNIDLIAFLNHPCRVYRTRLPSNEKGTYLSQLRCRSDETQINLVELRNERNNKIQYWMQQQDERRMRAECDFSLQIKSEVEIVSQQTKSRKIIKVIIKRYCQPPENLHIFDSLIEMPSGKYVFKKNFCQFKLSREIEYPSSITIDVVQSKKTRKINYNQVVLCLNQSNLQELPFFAAAVQKINDHNKIGKIIGHPSSLFLILLIDQTGKSNQCIKEAILNYKQSNYPVSVPIQAVTLTQIIRGILFRAFSQQNLLNPSLAQFLIDNIVEKQFVQDFIKLIQLYYRIFLKEDIDSKEIETVIQHYFYQQEQKLQQYCLTFSSLFNFIEWKHNLQVNHLLQSFQIIAKKIQKKAEELTLQDLYNYNNVQFTFIALDLTDKIVRFFNCSTTPKMPIVTILSLIQFLPTPYKSIYWLQQWGRYRIQNGQTVRQINITQHEIVDSRFLLQTPLDMIEDESLRRCYMKAAQNQIIHAISSARKKATQMPQIQQLKNLLKGMKSKAIDAIPKLRLIWKVLTTKNRIELDLNNFETFHQIPIISRFVSLDETFKVYLDNLNREANKNSTIISIAPLISPITIQIDKISANLNPIQKLLNEFIQTANLRQNNIQQFYAQLDNIQRRFHQHYTQSYDDYLYLINKVQGLIKGYQIQAKYKYKIQMEALLQNINKHKLAANSQQINSIVKTLFGNLRQVKLRVRNERQNDLNSPSFLRDTYSLIEGVQKVVQKMIELLSQYKKDVRKFNDLFQERQLQCILLKYDKILYRLCNGIHKALFQISEDKRVYNFYSEIYKYTPYLYQLQRLQRTQILFIERIKSIIPININKIHLVLSGQMNTLLPLGKYLICFKNKLKATKITNITSTNFHSVAAFLFTLNLDDETFLEELVGLQRLVKTIKTEDQNIDLLQMLLRPYQRYDEFEEEANDQLYLKIAKKYQKAFKLLIQLQQTSKTTKRLNIHKLYQLIDQYDKEQQSQYSEFKQQQIIKFLQGLLILQKDHLRKINLINQNKEMIQQKMKLNKVGIKFMIRFLYRHPQREVNWLSIHLHKHKSLRLLQQHLKQLFSKYSLSSETTLQQFNNTNGMGIQLSFVLINYHRNRYDSFNSSQKGYVKLLDLLVTAVSSPLDFPARMISIRQMDNTQRIKTIIRKNNNQFTESFKDEAYWSSYGCNTIPFHLISNKQKDTFYCALQFADEAIFNHHLLKRSSSIYRKSLKQINQQKNNLRVIDLLSMWWTKSKKLTPEMKEILFSSIFESPFLYYYYILQNSSYEALINNRDKRNLMNLNEDQANLRIKGYIIANLFNQDQKDTIVFKLRNLGEYLQLEVIAIRSNLQIKVQNSTKYLQEGQEYHLQNGQNLLLSVYKFTQKDLEHVQITFSFNQPLNNTKYYQLKIDNDPVTSELVFSQKDITILPVKAIFKKTTYKLDLCTHCGKKQCEKNQGSTSSTCFKSEQRPKRGNLNMYLLAREQNKSDFKQFKQRVIEEVRKSVIIENRKTKQKGFLCFSCCFKPKDQEQ